MMLTAGRIGLAPAFFLLYALAGNGSPALLAACWAVFLLIEASDLLDGHFARLLRQESELGKILDPFADSLSRLTYFIAFAGTGILPAWILLILVYRDVGVAYIRVMVSRKKVLMPARVSGKLKAWVYAFAGVAGLLVFSLRKMGWIAEAQLAIERAAIAVFLMSAAIALWSLADYTAFFLKNFRKGD